jgi:hypothetical protein
VKDLTTTLLLIALFMTVARAEDDVPSPEAKAAAIQAEKTAKLRISKYKSKFKSRKVRVKCNALVELCTDPHPLIIQELAKVAKRERMPEVKDALFMLLGDMKPYVQPAGDVIKAHIRRHEDHAEILKSMARSIGRLGYAGAHDELLWLLDHNDQGVVTEAIRALGDVKDLLAIPKLYDLAEFEGKGFSWSTGEVKVDTGAAGTADQEAAEAAWKAKYGNVRRRGAGQSVVKMWMRELRDALEKITGKKFKDMDEFKAWMEEHRKEIGLPPKSRR